MLHLSFGILENSYTHYIQIFGYIITVLLHTRCHRNKFVKKGILGLNKQWYILRKVSVRKRLAPKFMLFINGIHSHIGFIRRRGEEEGQTPKK